MEIRVKQYVSGDTHVDRRNDLLDRLIKTNVAVLNNETQQHDHSTALDLPCRKDQLKCDGTRAETRFRLGGEKGRVHLNRRKASVQTTTVRIGVSNSGRNTGYTMFQDSVKSTGYPLHSPV
jgi:hypothetical protein